MHVLVRHPSYHETHTHTHTYDRSRLTSMLFFSTFVKRISRWRWFLFIADPSNSYPFVASFSCPFHKFCIRYFCSSFFFLCRSCIEFTVKSIVARTNNVHQCTLLRIEIVKHQSRSHKFAAVRLACPLSICQWWLIFFCSSFTTTRKLHSLPAHIARVWVCVCIRRRPTPTMSSRDLVIEKSKSSPSMCDILLFFVVFSVSSQNVHIFSGLSVAYIFAYILYRMHMSSRRFIWMGLCTARNENETEIHTYTHRPYGPSALHTGKRAHHRAQKMYISREIKQQQLQQKKEARTN